MDCTSKNVSMMHRSFESSVPRETPTKLPPSSYSVHNFSLSPNDVNVSPLSSSHEIDSSCNDVDISNLSEKLNISRISSSLVQDGHESSDIFNNNSDNQANIPSLDAPSSDTEQGGFKYAAVDTSQEEGLDAAASSQRCLNGRARMRSPRLPPLIVAPILEPLLAPLAMQEAGITSCSSDSSEEHHRASPVSLAMRCLDILCIYQLFE